MAAETETVEDAPRARPARARREEPRAEPRREEPRRAPPRSEEPRAPRQDDRRDRRRANTDEQPDDGSWNGPIPDFLKVSFGL